MKKKKTIFKRLGLLAIILLLGLIPVIYFRPAPFPEEIPPPVIRLYLHRTQEIIELDIEEYICGVVAAEMPASFELEALKAQALCARTYACQKILTQKEYPLNADLSDDISSCQAYVSWEEFEKLHPVGYQAWKSKIQLAVTSTRGEIITYQNQPIDALYHSTCGGNTESAAAAWGADIPYLQSVQCNYCSSSKYYQSEQVISYQELRNIYDYQGSNPPDISISQISSSGRAREIILNHQVRSAGTFRQLLNLPSTCWNFQKDKDSLIINSRGYGHGVGLCQYGANGLALAGKNYREILSYYYQDTGVRKVSY